MDDITRDVAQRQAAQRQAHNQYVVPAVSSAAPVRHRFSWHDLDRGIQEQILQDAPPHSRRYFTNPRGGFNWAELERGVRAQILNRLVHHEHLPLQVVRRFCTAAEDRSGRLDLERHGLEPWPESIVNSVPTDYWYLFDRDLSTIQNLTFVTQGPLLNVTFSTRFGAFNDEDEDEQWVGTTAQLNDLFSQMKRTYSWTGVRAIRLIRHDGHDSHDPNEDEFTFEFVRRGEHGDEVIEATESFRLSRAQRDELATLLRTRLRMRHREMRELGNRVRTRYWMGGARPGDPPLEHPNGEEWSVRRVPAAAGAAAGAGAVSSQ